LGPNLRAAGKPAALSFWRRQKNVTIPAIRTCVNFLITAKMAEICQWCKFWRLSYVKANFFSFVKKGDLQAPRENFTRVFPSANPRLG
jgi:hypothetical protein